MTKAKDNSNVDSATNEHLGEHDPRLDQLDNEVVGASEDVIAEAEAEEAHADEQGESEELDETQRMIDDLTADLQRTRADFENYQKRTMQERELAKGRAVRDTVAKILPVVDIIEQAIGHMPEDILDTPFGKGMASIDKKLAKQLAELGVEKIKTDEGDEFNPELHNAIQVDEEAEGEVEVIASALQSGYVKDGEVIRYSMVRVTRR